MDKEYDIFISYRREGGYDTAKHLYDLLCKDGYRVSFDIDTLRNGDFDTQLYSRIDACKDFILIVDKHAFDRTLEGSTPAQNDWLRCELAYALKKGKNVIPVFLSGTDGFPAGLPDDIKDVARKNGPEYNRYYFDEFYRVLKGRFLHETGRISHRYIFLSVVLFVIVCSAGMSMLLLSGTGGKTPDAEATDSVYVEEDIVSSPEDDDTPYVSTKTKDQFVKGLTKSLVYRPIDDTENRGALYHFADGRKLDIRIVFDQVGFSYTSIDEGGETTELPLCFDGIGCVSDAFGGEYEDNEYAIGQYDLDGDSRDELVVAIRTSEEKEFEDNSGICINVLKLIGGRWELLAKLNTNSNVQPVNVKFVQNNIYVYWLRYDEKFVFVNNDFESVDNESRVFTESDFE